MNVVTLIGNLATDVDVRELADDKRVASFVLAVDRPNRDEEADFFRIAAWNRQAELCAQYLAKGSHVAVDGRLRSRSWEEEGRRRTAVEVVANRVEFLESRGSNGGRVSESAAAEVPFEAGVRP